MPDGIRRWGLRLAEATLTLFALDFSTAAVPTWIDAGRVMEPVLGVVAGAAAATVVAGLWLWRLGRFVAAPDPAVGRGPRLLFVALIGTCAVFTSFRLERFPFTYYGMFSEAEARYPHETVWRAQVVYDTAAMGDEAPGRHILPAVSLPEALPDAVGSMDYDRRLGWLLRMWGTFRDARGRLSGWLVRWIERGVPGVTAVHVFNVEYRLDEHLAPIDLRWVAGTAPVESP